MPLTGEQLVKRTLLYRLIFNLIRYFLILMMITVWIPFYYHPSHLYRFFVITGWVTAIFFVIFARIARKYTLDLNNFVDQIKREREWSRDTKSPKPE